MTRRRAIVACHKRLFAQQRGGLHSDRAGGAQKRIELTLTCMQEVDALKPIRRNQRERRLPHWRC